jgi:hypothetical protein
MAARSRVRLILIVTGSCLRAEEADRPLAYYLKQQIDELIKARDLAESIVLKTRVVADLRWLNEEAWQQFPTISVGGPGVNVLTQRWLDEIPLVLSIDGQYYIHVDLSHDELRASIWGMDNSTTQVATSAFIQRYLSQFLDSCQAEITDSIDLEEDS